ncbi:MAG TPA: energy transducer TonB, partial [Albitalea sp.]
PPPWPVPSPAPAPASPEPVPAAPVEAAAPAPAPAPTIPPSAVQYIEPPPLAYPRASRRAGESGRVVLRVFIDATGLPREVQVQRSSGFARLDAAAAGAVLKARFKPYSDHGQAIAGWALVPLTFDLET